jgi:hypothetical protein
MTRTVYAIQHEWDPSRGFTAYVEGEDDMGPDNVTGWGRTRDEVVADLEEQLADIACKYAARIETHCETARSDDWLALVRACNELEKTNGN